MQRPNQPPDTRSSCSMNNEADDATHASSVQIQRHRAVDVCGEYRRVRARAIPVLWGPRGPRVAARLRLQRARSAF